MSPAVRPDADRAGLLWATSGISGGRGCQICDHGHLLSSTVLHTCRESRKVGVVFVHAGVFLVSSVAVWRVAQFVYSSLSVFADSVCVFHIRSPSARFPFIPLSPGSSGAVLSGNVLSGRQSCVAPCPSRHSPTAPSALQSLSFAPPPAWRLRRGAAGPVRAARCPCISCAGWRPGP